MRDLAERVDAGIGATGRTDRDLNIKVVFLGVLLVFVAMLSLYYFFIAGAGNLSRGQIIAGSVVAAAVIGASLSICL